MSLRRPPQRQDSPDPTSNKSKLRTHAVSLNIGDYTDNNADDMDLEAARLREQEEWGGQEKTLAQQAQKIQSEDSALRKRWLENAKAPVRVPTIDERGRAYGRGGRKTASASVWIQPGMGHVVVNRKDFVDYFERLSDRELLLAPLAATKTCGLFDVIANVQGGGLTGQAGAIRHGLARALNHYNPDVYRPPLKRLGFLTRDPRKVERKKIGHKKARKKPQWVKR
jgi:small subunit ribosomal protein S9